MLKNQKIVEKLRKCWKIEKKSSNHVLKTAQTWLVVNLEINWYVESIIDPEMTLFIATQCKWLADWSGLVAK